MFGLIKQFIKYYSQHGVDLPTVFDNRVNRGSVSLLFAYIANALAIWTIYNSFFEDAKFATISAMCYSCLMICFYMLRTLSKVKMGITDGDIELESQDKPQEKKDK